MFKDATYRTSVRKAKLTDGDNSQTLEIGFDVEVPVRDYERIDANLAATVNAAWNCENFKQTQFALDSKPCRLTFGPKKNDLTNDRLTTVLQDVQFAKKITVARKRDPDDKGDTKVLLQLNTSIAATEANVIFAKNYFGNGAWCRFVTSQTQMQLEPKKKSGKKALEQEKLDLDKKKAPKLSKVDERLIDSLHSTQDAEKRWQKRRESGLTNAELKQAISYEFGIGGGSSGPGKPSIAYAGKTNPRFWYGKKSPTGAPTLKGKELVAKVRKILEIPFPVKQKPEPKKKRTTKDETRKEAPPDQATLNEAIAHAILRVCPPSVKVDMLVDIENASFTSADANEHAQNLRRLLVGGDRNPSVEIKQENLLISFSADGCQVWAEEEGFIDGDVIRELTWPELVKFIQDNPGLGVSKGGD